MNLANIFDLLIALLIGSIIGGTVVFMLLRDKLKSTGDSGLAKRVEILEQVAAHVGKVSYVFGKYASLVSEIGPRTERMSARQERELDALSESLVDVYEEVSIAESKLLLLGELRLEKALKLYTAKMAQFRKQIYPGRYRNAEEASQLKKEVNEMREQFYNNLSDRYDLKAS